jgi:hypothetical protein
MVARHAVLADDLLHVVHVRNYAAIVARERRLRAHLLRQGDDCEENERRQRAQRHLETLCFAHFCPLLSWRHSP